MYPQTVGIRDRKAICKIISVIFAGKICERSVLLAFMCSDIYMGFIVTKVAFILDLFNEIN